MVHFVTMKWQPEGKRKVGRPKPTWRRTVEKRIQARGVEAGPMSEAQRKKGLVGERRLQPSAPYGVERTN